MSGTAGPDRGGEIAVIGLGRSGRAAAVLLAQRGAQVYASDGNDGRETRAAAETLRAAGVAAETGGHDLARIARAAMVVVSPGVPPGAAPLAAARAAGVPIVSEVEIGLRELPRAAVIAVTGTNGKTTTTALIAHLLSAVGRSATAAGNIGTPLCAFASRATVPDWFALEISSFQLHDTPGLAPRVGVLTNLAPDHLDRYDSVEAYYADKALLFRNATASSVWVWNAASAESRAMTAGVPGRHATFTASGAEADGWYDRGAGQLMVLGAPLAPRDALPLLGDHNVENALAAALAVMLADEAHRTPAARGAIGAAFATFHALAHRMEVVGEFGGVVWINDSKATNVSSTRVAVEGMTRPTVLLLGGRHKGEPYTNIGPALRRTVKRVLAYGESAELIEADLRDAVPVERLGSSFEAVVERARHVSVPGDAVLLSPACSSYDMFANYEERGAEFRRLAARR